MKLEEIGQEASYYMGGEPINLATVAKFTNKCMDTLSNLYDTACIKKSTTIKSTDVLQPYPLPSDCIGVYKVRDGNTVYGSYKIAEDGIVFGMTGDLTVEYFATPVLTARTNLDPLIKDDEPPINVSYHKCIAKYIACELIKLANPDDKRIEIYTNDITKEAMEIDSRLRKMKRRKRRIQAPIWG